MAEQGIHKVDRLRRQYISYQLLADGFFAAALAGLSGLLWLCDFFACRCGGRY